MNRRTLLRTSALASLAAPFFGSRSSAFAALAADNAYRENIGIQLYTLRNEIGADTEGTIQAVVDAGYKQGEMYGFPDCDEMIAAAKDSGLALHSSHFNWDVVTAPKNEEMSDFQNTLAKAKDVGLSHLVIPYLHDHERTDLDAYRRFAENANKAAILAEEAGIQLAYHNHSFEFQPMGDDNDCGYDILLAEFEPNMHFEIDVFWIKAGDRDPVEFISHLENRVSQLHLKDLAADIDLPIYNGMPKEAFEELGDGSIPMEPIIEAAAAAGVAHCHVEQDHSPHPLESIQQSLAHLKTL